MENIKIAYFGGEPIGVPVLEELLEAGLKPSLVVCNPDRPSGRGQQLTSPLIKQFAEDNGIEVWQPENLKDQETITEKLNDYDLFVVVAYNHIMPEWLIELPKYKTINLHPSMLPLRRGPNPIRSAIVEDDRASIGVSVMLMDKEMDHGPILAQQPFTVDNSIWPLDGRALDDAMAIFGGNILADTIPRWVAGELTPIEQEHDKATYTSKVSKADGELELDPTNLPTGDTALNMLHKITGYAGFPGTFFFYNEKRIKITNAELTNGQLCIKTVIPEGKSEMDFNTFLQSLN